MKRNQDWAHDFHTKTENVMAHFVDFKSRKALCGRTSKEWRRVPGGKEIEISCCSVCLRKKLKREGVNL